MPKPTLMQRAFGSPTRTYADGHDSPLFADPLAPYTQSFALSQSSGMSRAPSIRSVSSSRAPSESGRSRRNVTFDDGASDTRSIRSYSSSIRSFNTTASKRSALALPPFKSNGAMEIGPSLRSGQSSGLLLTTSGMRMPKMGQQKTSRRYSSAENMAALQAAKAPPTALSLPPPPMSKAEEAYAASQRRIAGLASISGQPPSPVRSEHSLRASTSSDSGRSHDSPSRASGSKRSHNMSTSVPRKKKTAEEIVAAMEKAGILDRVMEVLPEEDEPGPEKDGPASLAQTQRPSFKPPAPHMPPPPVTPAFITQPSPTAQKKTAAQVEPPTLSPLTVPSTRTDLVSESKTSLAQASPSAMPLIPDATTGQPSVDATPPMATVVAPANPVAATTPPMPVTGERVASEPLPPVGVVGKAPGEPAIPPEPAAVPIAAYERQMLWTAPPLSASPFATSPLRSAVPTSTPKVRPPPVSLITTPKAEPTESCPLVLTKLVFERISGKVILTGRLKGLRPPLYALVRYTMNGWNSYTDVEVETNGTQDFSVDLLTPMHVGRFELAVRMRDVTGREIWDSNSGKNYMGTYEASSLNADSGLLLSQTSSASATPKWGSRSPSPAPPPQVQSINPPTAQQQSSTIVAATVAENLPSPSSAASVSDTEDMSRTASTIYTTPPDSMVGMHRGVAQPVPVKAPAIVPDVPDSIRSASAVVPKMTLTRSESAQNEIVDLPMPTAPTAPVSRRVSFTPDSKEDESDRPSQPFVPLRSVKKTSAPTMPAVTSWAPNAKSLSGPDISTSLSKTKPGKTTAVPAAIAPITPAALSDSLPKARSVAQTLAEGLSASVLADSLPKAPPRASLAMNPPDSVAQTAGPASPVTEPSVHSRASGVSGEALPQVNGVAHRDVRPELGAIEGAREPTSGSISGQSFSNEPFVAQRSKLASLDASLAALEGAYISKESSSTHSRTSMVANAPARWSGAIDLPDIPLSDRMPSRRYGDSGPPIRGTMSAMDTPRFLPKAPRSIFSDSVSVDGRSDLARSVMSVPLSSRNIDRVGYLSATINGNSATMCAIAIMSNAATSLSRSRFSMFNTSKGRNSSNPPPHANGKMGGAQARALFTENASAPKKLGSSEVLVQIYAVGIDLWDRARVSTLVERGDGYGYIPGRSFCGKVVEVGIEVTRVHKGDFVYGLQDLRKSGALADLCVVNRDFVALAPQGTLSVEAIASLPCCGVPAFQAMDTLCRDLPKGSKVLILGAHIGVGALALQLSQCLRRGQDLWVTCQCPLRASEADEFCRANGASETAMDDPLVVLNSLHESSYDAIIDTVGGRRIYDAARRVLHHEGLFVTVVGNELAPPTTKVHWRAGIRSLRRAFVKKDKKLIGYLCPGLDEREDCRESLDRLTSLAEASLLSPVVKRILPFEEGGLAFADLGENEEGTVVRVLET